MDSIKQHGRPLQAQVAESLSGFYQGILHQLIIFGD